MSDTKIKLGGTRLGCIGKIYVFLDINLNDILVGKSQCSTWHIEK